MKKLIKCKACDGGKRQLTTAEGIPIVCPYCRDHPGKMETRVPHPSHKMSKWRVEPRCPCDTTRFYKVRECINCGEEELKHPAGHFLNKLENKCESNKI